MKNVVIICHDFPPLKSVAANRPDYWMKNLPQYGFHVTLFTRNWPDNISSLRDKFRYTDLGNEHLTGNGWDLYKSPINKTLRSEIISRYGFEKFVFIRKVLSFFIWFTNFFTISHDEYSQLYHSIKQYLKSNKADILIVSGSPFYFFKYGWYFSKKYNIPWLADYRDEWANNHSQLEEKNRMLFQNIELYFEKKWTSGCAAFISVSNGFLHRISSLINKKGLLIRNGYNELIIPISQRRNFNVFQIAFAGTIYDSRYLEVLEKGIDLFNNMVNGDKNVQFVFIGIELNRTKGTERIYELQSKYPDWIKILPPMEYSICLQELSGASVLLNLIVGNVSSGILATKIYDYLALNKPILNIETVYSNDIHEFSSYLIDCKNSDDLANQIKGLYDQWKRGEPLSNNIDKELIIKYSRAFQTKVLATSLMKVLKNDE